MEKMNRAGIAVRILSMSLVLMPSNLGAADPQPVTLKVSAVQFRPSQDVADNRVRIIRALEKLSGEGVQVAVFPECALTGYDDTTMKAATQEVISAEELIRSACRDRHIAAVFGSIHRVGGKTFNTAVVIDSRGELIERYGKMHAGERWATSGNHIAFFELEKVKSTVIVCHDERFPELVRLPALQGARIVYYISSESFLTREEKLAGYRAQMMARAVENSIYVVAANTPASPRDLSGSHGQSRIIDADGNIVKEGSFFKEDILTETLTIKPAKHPPVEAFDGPWGAWWRQGVELMMQHRNRKLD